MCIGDRDHRALGTILAHLVRELADHPVGQSITKHNNIVISGVNEIHTLIAVGGNLHVKSVLMQYFRTIKCQFPDAAKHQDTVAIGRFVFQQ